MAWSRVTLSVKDPRQVYYWNGTHAIVRGTWTKGGAFRWFVLEGKPTMNLNTGKIDGDVFHPYLGGGRLSDVPHSFTTMSAAKEFVKSL